MGIKLILNNRYVAITGAPRSLIREMEKATSYRVAGYMFAPSFKRGFWDGKEHLLTHSDKHGYRCPIGLLDDLIKVLDNEDFDWKTVDNRQIHGERRKLRWNSSIELRPYQQEAARSIGVDIAKQLLFGMGIWKMAIRSGKTKTVAKWIQLLGLRTVFIVPSKQLLYQTQRALQDAFPGEDIGLIGEGEWDVQFITVATIQTLTRARGRRKSGDIKAVKRRPEYTELISTTDNVVFDEAHHITGGGEWHKTFYDFDARFRIGLSATAYLDRESEQERGIIWLKACCGPIRIDIGMSRLINEGWLMKQHVRLFKISEPEGLSEMKWSQTLRSLAITKNIHRNVKIAEIAQELGAKMKVLIVCNRLEQIAEISRELWDIGVEHTTITGADKQRSRDEKVEGLIDGDYNVVIGTVLSEGVDIPEIEVVINAEGGTDIKNTIQRMRNMTISDGKSVAMLVDFIDEMNPYFAKHSKARMDVYEGEDSFNVELVA